MKDEQKGWPLTVQILLLARFVVIVFVAALTLHSLNLSRVREEEAAPAAAPAGGQQYLIPLGRTVGIKLFSDGVMVVGLSNIASDGGDTSPAFACGLQMGDIITHINGQEVNSIEEVQSILQSIGGEKMSLRVLRKGSQLQLTAQAVRCTTDGTYKLGAWIRDSMAGIGTTTFYDPETGIFGALGHGISDIDTSMLMPLGSGSIMYASVVSVKKGLSGQPGELQGTFQVNRDMGELYANTPSGIFGLLTDTSLVEGLEPVPVARRSEVKVGPAVILSNITGNTVEEYAIEIVRVYPRTDSGAKDLMIKVTDPRLLESTGGIVQGMSGSPILQNGKLVGAVTHVFINDPTQGYGILAQTMLSHLKLPEGKSAA